MVELEATTQVEFERIMQRIVDELYGGRIAAVDQELFKATYDHLIRALTQQFPNFEELGDAEKILYSQLRENVYLFSAGKTYATMEAVNQLMIDPSTGTRRLFNDFKKAVQALDKEVNVNHLRTEYNTAISSARGAKRWGMITAGADALPLLQYESVGDARVRDEHRSYDGIVLPVEHSFWDTHYPPNGWGCRCTIRRLREGEKPVSTAEQVGSMPAVPELFAFNAGKQGVMFTDAHPYFEVAQSALQAGLERPY